MDVLFSREAETKSPKLSKLKPQRLMFKVTKSGKGTCGTNLCDWETEAGGL